MKWITEVIEENSRKKQKEFLKDFHKNFKHKIIMNTVEQADEIRKERMQVSDAINEEIKHVSVTTRYVEHGIPRRARIDLLTPAEKAICDAVQLVEKLPCHVSQSNAVGLLDKARNEVAEVVDDMLNKRDADLARCDTQEQMDVVMAHYNSMLGA